MRKTVSSLIIIAVLLFSLPSFLAGKDETPKRVFVIPVHGEINRRLVIFVRRSIERAKAGGADIVIFDIDTFGGRVDAALQITTLIGSLEPALTIAYITAGPGTKGVSWSAGALIAFSCNRIFMAPGTSIGAAAPVIMGSGGMQAASEKVVSAVRTQMAALAEKNGYPPTVAKAMVDEDIVLKEVIIDGEYSLAAADEIEDIKRNALKSGKKFEIGKVISPAGKLLTLTARQMEKYGVSSGTPKSLKGLLVMIRADRAELTEIKKTAADRAVAVITGPFFIGLLIMIGLAALYIEITTPGFGIPGAIAIICFAVVFTGYGLLGMVGSVELLLFIAGIVLLILEIFVIPGFGVAGISGIVLIMASLVLSMQGFVLPSVEWEKEIFKRNILTVGIGVVASFIVFSVLAYSLPKLKLFSPLTLHTQQNKNEGYTVQPEEEYARYMGKKGTAVTKLRPSGKAKFGDEVLNVESDGEFIEPGTDVEVIEVSGNRIVVRKC